jgi:hypothetical protein
LEKNIYKSNAFLAGTKPVSARSTRISGGLWISLHGKKYCEHSNLEGYTIEKI